MTNVYSHVTTTTSSRRLSPSLQKLLRAPLSSIPSPSPPLGSHRPVNCHQLGLFCSLLGRQLCYRPALVSWGWHNKCPQTWWLKAAEMYSLKSQRPEICGRGVSRAAVFWKLGGESVRTPPPHVAASHPWHPGFIDASLLSVPPLSHGLCLHMAFL